MIALIVLALPVIVVIGILLWFLFQAWFGDD